MSEEPITAAVGITSAAPVVNGRPEEIADGVFVIPDGRVPLVPNVGAIVGDRAVVVVDSGLGPRSGALVREIAKELAGDRPLMLTLTHFHPEHGYGAQAFGDATIVYNREQRDELREKGAGYLDTFRGMSSDIAHELEDVEFVDPHVVYDGSADLDLGGKAVRLRSWGAAHSRGDQAIYLPAEGVLFTGDLVENRFFPILPFVPPYDTDVDGANWLAVLEELQRFDAKIVVPGHGEVGDAGLIATYHEYLSLLRSETKRLAGEGNDADAIFAILEPELRARYADWDASEPWRVATGIQAFLAE